jgi:hypothetical protein
MLHRRARRAAHSRAAGGIIVWSLAPALIWLIYFAPVHTVSVQTAVTGLLGLGIVTLAARRPDRSLIVLIVLLPFQGFLLARLWAWGVPTSLVRHLAAWKEALSLGVVAAGIRAYLASGRRADLLDRLALGFVAIAALYLLAQATIVPSAPSAPGVRLLGFRQDAGFVLLLLGARHAPLPAGFLDRAGRAALLVAGVVGGVCVFEALGSRAWNQFVVHTIRYPHYEVGVLHTTPPNLSDIRVYGMVGGTQIVRAGSVFLNPLTCGFYLVFGFALGLERAVRGQAQPWVIPALLAAGAGMLLTQTRSAILAALIVALLAFQPAAGRRRQWRAQLAIALAGLAILAVPAALSTGVVRRIEGAPNNSDHSGAAHVSAFWQGVRTLEAHPLGLGLGTSAGIGQRFQDRAAQVVVPENDYLQVGIELGVGGLVVFASLSAAAVWQLRASSRAQPQPVNNASWSALAGLVVAAWFLQTWLDFSVAWTVWGMAGASLGTARSGARAPAPAAVRAAQPDIPHPALAT